MNETWSLMPTYTIRLPGRFWNSLRDQNAFNDAPPQARDAFLAAEEILRPGGGTTRRMTGSSVELNAVLEHLRYLVESIHNRCGTTRRNSRTPGPTAQQYDISLYDFDRFAYQPLTRIKKPTR